jgi:two-component system chemotaxis response regulator CheB
VQDKNKIRVLIVDDSAFIRTALRNIINSASNLEVVGEAKDGREGVELAMDLAPDVITMDVEMPVMNGIEATKEICKYAKIPIIMLSTLTSTGAEATLDALTYGAVDFITKKANSGEFKQLKDEIIDKITNIYSSSNIKKIFHRNF